LGARVATGSPQRGKRSLLWYPLRSLGCVPILELVTKLLSAAFVAISLALCCVATATAGPPSASAAQACKPPKYPGNGYFTSLNATHTSCTRGREVTMAYYRCRIRKGIRARCTSPVLGFRCKEVRQTIPTEFDAKVTCTRGRSRVVHTYQQNT
jgi:hypothetical protein